MSSPRGHREGRPRRVRTPPCIPAGPCGEVGRGIDEFVGDQANRIEFATGDDHGVELSGLRDRPRGHRCPDGGAHLSTAGREDHHLVIYGGLLVRLHEYLCGTDEIEHFHSVEHQEGDPPSTAGFFERVVHVYRSYRRGRYRRGRMSFHPSGR